MLNIKGIDLAWPQTNFDYSGAKNEGYEYAIIKASQYNYQDSQFNNHVTGCKNAGFKIGFYHFFTGQGQLEAETFVNAIKNITQDIIPFIDVEADWNANEVTTFINYVENKLGTECGIYCNYSYYKELIKYFPNKKYWLAYYGSTLPIDDIVGWQYTDQEYVAGSNTDKNYFSEDILINKLQSNNELIGGIYNMAGKINARAKYIENGAEVWTKWYNMDEASCDPYKNFVGLEIYTDVPLEWAVLIKDKWVSVKGSAIIDGGSDNIKGFKAKVSDGTKNIFYWVSSPGDEKGYEWWDNACCPNGKEAICRNSQGTTPINAIKIRLG